jgi:hypothetical protein
VGRKQDRPIGVGPAASGSGGMHDECTVVSVGKRRDSPRVWRKRRYRLASSITWMT